MQPRSSWKKVVPALAVLALVTSACGSGHSHRDDAWTAPGDGPGWPGQYGGSSNSSYADINAPSNLTLAWQRATGGWSSAGPAISPKGHVGLTADTKAGCNSFVLEMPNGRKLFCRRLGPGIDLTTPLTDKFDNWYQGQPAQFIGYDWFGPVRWRLPVTGTPTSAKFAADGYIFVTTQLGELRIIDAHLGKTVTQLNLDSNANPNPEFATWGLDQCKTARPGCEISAPPAIDQAHKRAYLTWWKPGAKEASLVSVSFGSTTGDDGSYSLRTDWIKSDVPGGVGGSPVVSADGKTVYVNDRKGNIVAVNASDGTTKWTHSAGHYSLYAPSVSPNGIIIPGADGFSGGPLLALQDRGNHADVLWEKKDTANLGLPVQLKGDRGFAVVRKGAFGTKELALIEFNTTNGDVLKTYDLPHSVGYTTGTAVGPNGEIVTTTAVGMTYAFTPS